MFFSMTHRVSVFLSTVPYIFKGYFISECNRNELLANEDNRKSLTYATAALGLPVISRHLTAPLLFKTEIRHRSLVLSEQVPN